MDESTTNTSLSGGNRCGPGTELVTRFKALQTRPRRRGPVMSRARHTAGGFVPSARPHNDRAGGATSPAAEPPYLPRSRTRSASDVSGQHVGDVLVMLHSISRRRPCGTPDHTRPRQAGLTTRSPLFGCAMCPSLTCRGAYLETTRRSGPSRLVPPAGARKRAAHARTRRKRPMDEDSRCAPRCGPSFHGVASCAAGMAVTGRWPAPSAPRVEIQWPTIGTEGRGL